MKHLDTFFELLVPLAVLACGAGIIACMLTAHVYAAAVLCILAVYILTAELVSRS